MSVSLSNAGRCVGTKQLTVALQKQLVFCLMLLGTISLLVAPTAALAPPSRDTAAESSRTWTDSTGEYTFEGTFISTDGKVVTLKSADGRVTEVPLRKLSKADQAYAAERASSGSSALGDDKEQLAALTKDFFEDLRTTERSVAKESLTKEAQQIAAKGDSYLMKLPSPDEHKRALTISKAQIDDGYAEVPVLVRVDSNKVRTKLLYRQEEGAWKVFAISAIFPDGERTINFESSGSDDKRTLASLVGQPLPFTGVTLDGRPVNLVQLQGKVVLIDFWATWCGPCLAEMPNILANYRKYAPTGQFEVVGVSVDRDLEKLQEFVAEKKIPWPILADNHPKNQVSMADQYGISGIPALILVDQTGRVAAVNVRGKRLGPAIEQVFADAQSSSRESAVRDALKGGSGSRNRGSSRRRP